MCVKEKKESTLTKICLSVLNIKTKDLKENFKFCKDNK